MRNYNFQEMCTSSARLRCEIGCDREHDLPGHYLPESLFDGERSYGRSISRCAATWTDIIQVASEVLKEIPVSEGKYAADENSWVCK